ncbi:MAG: 30S ribosome-binding factor RbfA [Actinobacteria bacterium]|nr:30S ribosome-binding factor RbfA [Actinomycetota bacterium]
MSARETSWRYTKKRPFSSNSSQANNMNRSRKTEVDLKREIGFIINSKIKDPRLGFVTITDVRLSPDFHYLDVFVSIMGEDKSIKDTLEILKNCDGFIKNNLKQRFKLRIMPEIKFIHDGSINQGMRISELLEGLKKGEK